MTYALPHGRASALEAAAELVVGGAEVFGDDAGLADGGHEVGVAGPAREDVKVQVVRDARARGLAEVHAEVEAVRAVDFGEYALGALRQLHQLVRGLFGQAVEVGRVLEGDDHEVAAGVWVDVEDDEVEPGALEDEGRLVVAQRGQRAEDAGV